MEDKRVTKEEEERVGWKSDYIFMCRQAKAEIEN